MSGQSVTERLLAATIAIVDARRALSEACERPNAPEYATPAYWAWCESDESKALGAREQERRRAVYAADNRWEAAAEDYYDATFGLVPVHTDGSTT